MNSGSINITYIVRKENEGLSEAASRRTGATPRWDQRNRQTAEGARQGDQSRARQTGTSDWVIRRRYGWNHQKIELCSSQAGKIIEN